MNKKQYHILILKLLTMQPVTLKCHEDVILKVNAYTKILNLMYDTYNKYRDICIEDKFEFINAINMQLKYHKKLLKLDNFDNKYEKEYYDMTLPLLLSHSLLMKKLEGSE